MQFNATMDGADAPSKSRSTHVQLFVKRCIDLLVAVGLLLLVSPVMLAIAFAIKLSSSGSVIYRQMRYGYAGRPFTIYKFRTLYSKQCDDAVSADCRQVGENDPRVTPLGAWLRRTGLDELPQITNVIKGNMSFVGPRPHAMAHDDYYSRYIPYYEARYAVKPGITGLAQVMGFRGETKQVDQMRKRIELDLYYVNYWGLAMDFKIMARTAKIVIGEMLLR
jgi:putative colanic acid biosynthesis UDP-glucose lipid carrier transferase